MERKIGEIFEFDEAQLRVEQELIGCRGCYFYRNGIKHCIGYRQITGECSRSGRLGEGVIFVKTKEDEQSILDEAKSIVEGSRQSDYGDPVESFNRIAKTASMMTGKDLTPKDCCAVLMAVKLVRESFRHKRDNLVDLCGYAEIMNRINDSNKKGE